MEREREREGGGRERQRKRLSGGQRVRKRKDDFDKKTSEKRQKYEIRNRETVKGERACVLCLFMCVGVCVRQKNDQALGKLKPWTAVSALLGLISKVQSNARA